MRQPSLSSDRSRSGSAVSVITVVILFSSFALGQTANESQSRELPLNQTLEREMTGAEKHRYRFDLKVSEFFQVRVEQKGVDVALTLADAAGKTLATMDSPNGKQGPETLSFVAATPGDFVLEVEGIDAKAEKGNYSIRREASRAATPKDKRRVEAERLFVAGMTARNAKGQTAIAIKSLTDAKSGWEDLEDGYMAQLTVQQINQIQIPPDIAAIVQESNAALTAANAMLQEGQHLAVKSKADSLSARAKLNEALAMFRALYSKLVDTGFLDKVSKSGATSQQTSSYFRALQIFTRSGEGLALAAIAQTHSNLGEWQENVDYLKLSVDVYRGAARALGEQTIGSIDQKENLRSLRYLEAGQLLNIASTVNMRLGRPEEGLKYFNEALELFSALYRETQDPRFKLQAAMTLLNIGLVYTNESQGRDMGIEYLGKAVEIYRAFPDQKNELASLLGLIGSQHAVGFEYEAALKSWEDALSIYRQLDDTIGQMEILKFKGLMYFLLNDKRRVRANFNQVLSILQSPEFETRFTKHYPRLQSSAGMEVFKERRGEYIERLRLGWIGDAYENLEDYNKAIEAFEKALAIARGQKEPKDIRSHLRNIGFAYIKLEHWGDAYRYYKQALEITRTLGVKEDVADDLMDVGKALMESGKPQEALEYQNEALALFHSVGIDAKNAFSPRYSPLLNELGQTHYGLGNRELAIFYGKQGVNAIQDQRQRLRNFDVQSQKGFLGRQEKHYRRLAEWLIAEGRIAEAEQVLAMLKEEELLSYLRRDASESNRLQERADLNPEERAALRRYNDFADKVAALGAEFGKLQSLQTKGIKLTGEQGGRYEELSFQIEDASRAFQVFLRQLAEEFAKRTNTGKDLQENLGLQSDLKSWGKGVVFLYTLVGDDRYRVILVTPNTQIDGKYEIKAADLNGKIEKFRAAAKDPRVDPRPLGKELYDILIKPVEKQLEGARAKTLLWSLDGNLRLVPLSALWDGEQYFGQKYQNVTITLASRTRLGDAVAANWRALGLGVSTGKKVTVKDIGGTHELVFDPLPGVKTELLSVVQSTRSPKGAVPGQSLLDGEFSETALESQLLRGYKVVHIASHFSLNPGDSTRSFLLLGDGSVLTVDEMKNNPRIKFAGVELLTLSACQTAVVEKDSSGKEIEGFGYVAQQKGAKAILATLWSVADESTSRLMSEFYRMHKANPAMTKAEALQRAQIAMIQGNTRREGFPTSNAGL